MMPLMSRKEYEALTQAPATSGRSALLEAAGAPPPEIDFSGLRELIGEPSSLTPRNISPNDPLAAVGGPAPEIDFSGLMNLLDQPRNVLFKVLSGIDKKRVGGTDVLEKLGMKPGMGRTALGFGMEAIANPLNALPGIMAARGAGAAVKGGKVLTGVVKNTKATPESKALAEVLDIFSRNKSVAAEVPSFQKQGIDLKNLEALLDAKKTLRAEGPISSPTISPDVMGLSVMSRPVEGNPEAISGLVQRMMTARKTAPEATKSLPNYGEMPAATTAQRLKEGRRVEQELINAKRHAAKEAMLRELAPQGLSATPSSPNAVIDGLRRLGYSDDAIVKMSGAERQSIWESAKPVIANDDIIAEEAAHFGMSIEEYTKKILGKKIESQTEKVLTPKPKTKKSH